MIKKLFFTFGITLVCSFCMLLVGQSKALACGSGVCGYFVNNDRNANCNVLPDPSIKYFYDSSNCWLNQFGGNGHSLLFGNNNTTAFINNMQTYLYESNGTQGYKLNSQIGAAFLIDDMLGRDQNNGTVNGLNDARAQFGTWVNAINRLSNGGANECSNAASLTCPGKSFGINWSYTPPYFCSFASVQTSGYDPDPPPYIDGRLDPHDAVLYGTTVWSCDHDWRASVPNIVFYWNNGANSFQIGAQCGNVQVSADKLPSSNSLPIGSLAVTCNAATATFSATFSFSDPDATTTATLSTSTGGWAPSFSAPGPYTQAIPQSQAGPYSPVTVYLQARDVGPLGDQAYHTVAQVVTVVPCAQLGCNVQVTSPTPQDAYTPYTITATVTNNANASPNGTVNLSVTPPVGVVYSWSGSKPIAAAAGSSAQAVFSGVPATGRTGLYSISGTFSGVGAPIPCSGSFGVVNLPYLNVYGGDVAVGASPTFAGGSSSCSTDPNGGAYSWNNHAAGFSGAGAQYAAQALAGIVDFASALRSSNTTPDGLAFANFYTPADPTKLNTAQGLFGGYFGATGGDCDFTSDITSAPITVDAMIPATTVPIGSNSVTYVSGAAGTDVYISGNIAYAGTGGWASVAQIPSYKVVAVGGDIYIDSNVTQLDGLYVAEPSSGRGGHIYTCASAIRVPVDLKTPGAYTTCNKRLVITGAFVASSVIFGRTYGSVGQATITDTLASNHDAEVFNYTPEVWLPRNATTPSNGYTAITGLPPVL